MWRHCPYGVHELLPGGDLAASALGASADGAGRAAAASGGGGGGGSSQQYRGDAGPLARVAFPGRAGAENGGALGPPQKYMYATLLREPVERLMSWMSWCNACARAKGSKPTDRCCGSPRVTPEPPLSNLTVYYSERRSRLEAASKSGAQTRSRRRCPAGWRFARRQLRNANAVRLVQLRRHAAAPGRSRPARPSRRHPPTPAGPASPATRVGASATPSASTAASARSTFAARCATCCASTASSA